MPRSLDRETRPGDDVERGGGDAVRFGLAGTGPWAALVHGPGLRRAPGIELVGVWGRRREAASALAGELGVTTYTDLDALFADVDAVAFALPPDIQAGLARRAAEAGKHVLLDKPVAVSTDLAAGLVDAVDRAGVASMVFFTDLLAPVARPWLDGLRRGGAWRGGWARWLATLDHPDNPFRESPWRHERGALWDVGPHAVAALTTALGPVTAVRAVGGSGDVVHLVLAHENGATSTATLTLQAPPAANGSTVSVWGDAGVATLPGRVDESVPDVFAVAARELVRAAETGSPHLYDVRFGARVTDVLAEAARQVASGEGRVVPAGGTVPTPTGDARGG